MKAIKDSEILVETIAASIRGINRKVYVQAQYNNLEDILRAGAEALNGYANTLRLQRRGDDSEKPDNS